MRQKLWLLVAILLLASATRLHDVGLRSLWEDEGWTLVLAKGPTIPDIVQRMANDQHPPLYFIAIHLWRDLTGSTEFALRSLSVLTALVAIAGIYQVGKAMFGQTTGILAALALALSDHHIDLSQDVRHYTQMATFAILSTWYYFEFIKTNHPSRHIRIGYVLTSIILLYSHYLGGFVLICQAFHMFIFVRPWAQFRWIAFHFAAICLAFLPWFPIVILQDQVRWVTPLYYLNSLPNSHQTYLMVRDALLGKQYAITLVLMILGLGYVNHSTTRIKSINSTCFLLLWLIGYAGMTYYLNDREGKQFLTIRNFVVMTPGITILVGHGLANLQTNLRMLIVTVLLVMSLTTVDTRQLKAPWREVVQNVTQNHNEDEPILMDIWVGDFPGRYYIEQQIGSDTPWLSLREARDEYNVNFLPVLNAYIQDQDALWVIYWRSWPIEQSDFAGILAQENFQQTAAFYVNHVGNRLYSYRYDRLTDETLAHFGNMFALKKYALKGNAQQGQTFTTQLWWTAEQSPTLDYSISVFLLDENGISRFNQDGQPQNGNAPTTTWQPQQLVFDQHTLNLPAQLPRGKYQLCVAVYYYQTADQPLKTDSGENWVVLEELEIKTAAR